MVLARRKFWNDVSQEAVQKVIWQFSWIWTFPLALWCYQCFTKASAVMGFFHSQSWAVCFFVHRFVGLVFASGEFYIVVISRIFVSPLLKCVASCSLVNMTCRKLHHQRNSSPFMPRVVVVSKLVLVNRIFVLSTVEMTRLRTSSNVPELWFKHWGTLARGKMRISKTMFLNNKICLSNKHADIMEHSTKSRFDCRVAWQISNAKWWEGVTLKNLDVTWHHILTCQARWQPNFKCRATVTQHGRGVTEIDKFGSHLRSTKCVTSPPTVANFLFHAPSLVVWHFVGWRVPELKSEKAPIQPKQCGSAECKNDDHSEFPVGNQSSSRTDNWPCSIDASRAQPPQER